MIINLIQHVHFEGPGLIAEWAESRGHEIETTRLFAEEKLPEAGNVEFLVLMGGPMNATDDDKFSWMPREKELILHCLREGVPVLGICLGAQLIASAAGASVKPMGYQEIGWFDVALTEQGKNSGLFTEFPEKFTCFHWHGDIFDIPDGAARLAGSVACPNQAFLLGNALGLQFHLEMSRGQLGYLINHDKIRLEKSRFIMTKEEIIEGYNFIESNRTFLFWLLDKLLALY